jgi:hypothetical protein
MLCRGSNYELEAREDATAQSISIIPCDARGEPICEIQFGIEDWTEIFKEMQEVAQAEVLRSMQ